MRRYKVIFGGLACTMLAGCNMPSHSNALVFATNTAIALDVSASPTAGAPNITVGYKRQEAAWVPLLGNKGGAADVKGDRPSFSCKKILDGKMTDHENCVFKGKTRDGDEDAYSVLASLEGGTAISTGEGSGTKTQANIGQYFATGMAARYLALKGGAALVNAKADPPAETVSPAALALAIKIEQTKEEDVKKIENGIRTGEKYQVDRDELITKAYPTENRTSLKLKSLATKEALIAYLNTDPVAASELAAQIK